MHGGSSATAAPGPMPGVAPSLATTSPRRRSGSSRCPGSSSSDGSPGPRSSSTCSTPSAGPSSSSGDARQRRRGGSSGRRGASYEELTRDAEAAAARQAEHEALVEGVEGLVPGEEDDLRAQRERLRHVAELGEAAATAADAVAPEEGDGAAALAGRAERALAPLERIAPEIAVAAGELRDLALRLQEVGSDLHGFLTSLEADPGAIEEVEGRLERIADLKRRFGAGSYDELLGARRGRAARARRRRRRARPGPGCGRRRQRGGGTHGCARGGASRGSPLSLAPARGCGRRRAAGSGHGGG